MGTRHALAAAALTACFGRGLQLPPAVALGVGYGASVAEVRWQMAAPEDWDGPVAAAVLPGLEEALAQRLGSAVGVARVTRWVEAGVLIRAARGGPVLSSTAPWSAEVRLARWGLRTASGALEAFY